MWRTNHGLGMKKMTEKLNKRLKIYVAYRYSADNVLDVLHNIGKAVEVGRQIAKLGHSPFVPHLDCLLAIFDYKNELPLSYYYNCSMDWLKASDALYVIDENDLINSKGVAAEWKCANDVKLPVYFSLDQIPKSCG